MERYHISGVPITDESGSLVGILTNRDLRFETTSTRPVSERDDQRGPRHRAGGHDAGGGARRSCTSTGSRSCPSWTSDGHLKGLITVKDIEKRDPVPATRTRTTRAGCASARRSASARRFERAAALVEAGVDVLVRRHRARPQPGRDRDGRARSSGASRRRRHRRQRRDRRGDRGADRRRAPTPSRSGIGPGLDLHHARRRGRRRAADHRRLRAARAAAARTASRSSPTAASGTRATSPRPSPPAPTR